LRLSFVSVAVEYSFAFGPAPVCVDVAVAVCEPFGSFPLLVGLAWAVPIAPNARAMEDASSVLFMVCFL
jgi:hypothetical protein